MDDDRLQQAIEEARAGDETAFAEIYRAYAPRVWGLCRRMLGSPDAADDATADIFVKLHRVMDTYDTSRSFTSWLLGVTSNHCIDVIRRRGVERRIFDTEALESPWQPAGSEPGPLSRTLQAEQRGRVRAAIEELPENYRTPLVMRYYGGLTYDEIAEAAGLTRNNVATLLFRAKKKLREVLAQSIEEGTFDPM